MLRDSLYRPWFKDNAWGFEIIEGDFLGTVIAINSMDFTENQDDLQLDYTVLSKPGIVQEDLSESELFKNVVSVIINDILMEAVSIYEQDRNNSTEESSS